MTIDNRTPEVQATTLTTPQWLRAMRIWRVSNHMNRWVIVGGLKTTRGTIIDIIIRELRKRLPDLKPVDGIEEMMEPRWSGSTTLRTGLVSFVEVSVCLATGRFSMNLDLEVLAKDGSLLQFGTGISLGVQETRHRCAWWRKAVLEALDVVREAEESCS